MEIKNSTFVLSPKADLRSNSTSIIVKELRNGGHLVDNYNVSQGASHDICPYSLTLYCAHLDLTKYDAISRLSKLGLSVDMVQDVRNDVFYFNVSEELASYIITDLINLRSESKHESKYKIGDVVYLHHDDFKILKLRINKIEFESGLNEDEQRVRYIFETDQFTLYYTQEMLYDTEKEARDALYKILKDRVTVIN